MGKTKTKTHKRTRHLEGEVKRLTAEIKRLKKSKDIDKDDVIYDSEGNDSEIKMIPCIHCNNGFMSEIDVVGRLYWKCSSCEKTKKI